MPPGIGIAMENRTRAQFWTSSVDLRSPWPNAAIVVGKRSSSQGVITHITLPFSSRLKAKFRKL